MEIKVDDHLDVRASLIGSHVTFKSGKSGHRDRELFHWKGRRWSVRLQAFVMQRETETTHGMLAEGSVERVRPAISEPDASPIWRAMMEVDQRREAGWQLRKLPTGVRAVFDLGKLRTLPSGKTGRFSSFNVEINGVLYLGQFHLVEQPEPMARPTEWDRSRGAKAGLPSLGKRR
jgi:hypothetical protein